ncbi:MAG TPA: PKD domain-containing protein [bacterium]|nr:PKD domain-containing protein [bacterium]
MPTRPRPHFITTLALAALWALGCQGSSEAPSAPPATGTETPGAPAPIPSQVLENDLGGLGQGMLGLNLLTIDLKAMRAELAPIRTAAAVGDSYDVDIYEFLRKSPCGDCLQVQGLGYTGNEVEVTLAAKHPFAFGPKRYDLHVFDVRGTLIPLGGSATQTTLQSSLDNGDVAVDARMDTLANADGWSTYFTEVVLPTLGAVNPPPAGKLFPYKLFFRDLAASNYDGDGGTFTTLEFPTGHNVMAMGEGFEPGGVKYRINVGAGGVGEMRFLFLLDAAYGASATRPTRLSPKYFLPEFHRKDPFEVTLQISGSQLIAGRNTDLAFANVTVKDWQGETPANPSFGPDSAPTSVKLKSGVSAIEFAVPGVLAGAPQTKLRGADFNGVVNAGEYWTTYAATFPFTNTALAPAGRYYAVVAARDDLYGAQEGEGVIGYNRELTVDPFSDITTYAIAPVDVIPNPVDCPGPLGPSADNPQVAGPGDGTFNQGKIFSFTIGNITSNDTFPLDKVQIDQSWDGNPNSFSSNGEVAISGSEPATAVITSDFLAIPAIASPVANHQVGFRILDQEGNCNYKSATITLWPPVTCPGTRGPSFSLNNPPPTPQGTNMNFTLNNLVRGGQTAITSITVTATGYPGYSKNVPVPPGSEPLTVNFTENFPAGTFGLITSDTQIQMNVRAQDAEGNCNTQSVTVTVQQGVPPPSFILIPNPDPATVVHGTAVQILIDNIQTPSSSIQSVQADPNWDGTPAGFANDPAVTIVMLDADTYRATYDYRSTAYLPTSSNTNQTFGIRVTNTVGLSTTDSKPVILNPNAPPVASTAGSATTFNTTTPYTLVLSSSTDANGNLNNSNWRIDWGDGVIQDPVTVTGGQITHSYATTTNKTITVTARDSGYGPTNGPAPLPAAAASTPVTLNITYACGPCAGFWCEGFECAATNTIPAGWVLGTGISSGSRFGIKRGSGLASGSLAGQTGILEESGALGAGTADIAFSANGGNGDAARWGVWSPPITIPNNASNYTLELVHRVHYSYGSGGAGNASAEGAKVYVKAGVTDPGTSETGVVSPPVLSNGPATAMTSPYNSAFCSGLIPGASPPLSYAPTLPGGNIAWGQLSNYPNPMPWITSTFNLNSYKGQVIRIYFVHGQNRWTTGGFCAPAAWNPDAAGGWRIDQVRIIQS